MSEYDATDDAVKSYYAAIAAKKARGDAAIRKEVVIGDCRETLIYALCEPGGVNPHYVGKTQRRTGKRHNEHISDALKKARLPVHRWVRSLYQRGLWSCLKYLEIVPAGEDWASRERYWIKRLRDEGAQLLNLTEGGEGLLGLKRSPASVEAGAQKLRRGAQFNCEQCSERFYRKLKEIKTGDCRFCSRGCYQEWQRGRSKPMPAGVHEKGIAAARASRRAQTHCKRGHPLSDGNLYINKRGARVCKECRKEHKRAYLQRHS